MSTLASPDADLAEKLKRAPLVGKGFASDVYAWGERQVLKLFHSGVSAAECAIQEYNVTRSVYAAGLPAPATYELVAIEGRPGIVFERINGLSMFSQVQARPWTLFSAVRQLADLHAQIHRCVCPVELPPQREWTARQIERSPALSTIQKEAACRALADLPDGTALCHGDFHPGNVLFSARGPIVVDWGSATRGDPLGDVARTSRLIQTADLPLWAPRYMHQLLRYSRALLHRSYLKRSLQLHAGTRQQIKNWEVPLVAAMSRRISGT
jgi:uncharacterized protein (TIGR02172 family)